MGQGRRLWLMARALPSVMLMRASVCADMRSEGYLHAWHVADGSNVGVSARDERVLSDWYRLEILDADSPAGRPAPGLPADLRTAAYQRQLDQLHALLAGAPHTLPSFAEALAVQRGVEAILTPRGRDE